VSNHFLILVELFLGPSKLFMSSVTQTTKIVRNPTGKGGFTPGCAGGPGRPRRKTPKVNIEPQASALQLLIDLTPATVEALRRLITREVPDTTAVKLVLERTIPVAFANDAILNTKIAELEAVIDNLTLKIEDPELAEVLGL
jgi:hypothetical protein